ncbi:MAG: hypothetical protein Q8P22_10405 [Chloroflexota bacterium]|nr:hypothetical protein [Chloroflexota bacterium]
MKTTTIVAGSFVNGLFYNAGSSTVWGSFSVSGDKSGTYSVAWTGGDTVATLTLTVNAGGTTAPSGNFDVTTAVQDAAGNGETGAAQALPGGAW